MTEEISGQGTSVGGGGGGGGGGDGGGGGAGGGVGGGGGGRDGVGILAGTAGSGIATRSVPADVRSNERRGRPLAGRECVRAAGRSARGHAAGQLLLLLLKPLQLATPLGYGALRTRIDARRQRERSERGGEDHHVEVLAGLANAHAPLLARPDTAHACHLRTPPRGWNESRPLCPRSGCPERAALAGA